MKVSIEPEALQAMQTHAESTYPNECCGFLFGKEGETRALQTAEITENVKEGDQRRRFQISPEAYMKAERKALEEGSDLLGIYHSHPEHPAIPSEHDLKQALPFFSYVIVSLIGGNTASVRSWRLRDNGEGFNEEEVV